MNRRGYAHGTSVPVDRTRSEVEHLLTKHGASGFMYGTTNGQALVVFEMKDRRLKFLVPMPVANKHGSDEREVAAETRRRWRALLLVVVSGSTTVGDHMVPQMKAALASGRLPPLLGTGDPEPEPKLR